MVGSKRLKASRKKRRGSSGAAYTLFVESGDELNSVGLVMETEMEIPAMVDLGDLQPDLNALTSASVPDWGVQRGVPVMNRTFESIFLDPRHTRTLDMFSNGSSSESAGDSVPHSDRESSSSPMDFNTGSGHDGDSGFSANRASTGAADAAGAGVKVSAEGSADADASKSSRIFAAAAAGAADAAAIISATGGNLDAIRNYLGIWGGRSAADGGGAGVDFGASASGAGAGAGAGEGTEHRQPPPLPPPPHYPPHQPPHQPPPSGAGAGTAHTKPLRNAQGQYDCPHCGAGFAQSGSVRRHLNQNCPTLLPAKKKKGASPASASAAEAAVTSTAASATPAGAGAARMLKSTAGAWQEWALLLNLKTQRKVADDYNLSASERAELALAAKRFKKRQYQSRFRQNLKNSNVYDPGYKKMIAALRAPAPGANWPTWLLSAAKKSIPDMVQHLALTQEQCMQLYEAAASYKRSRRRDSFS